MLRGLNGLVNITNFDFFLGKTHLTITHAIPKKIKMMMIIPLACGLSLLRFPSI